LRPISFAFLARLTAGEKGMWIAESWWHEGRLERRQIAFYSSSNTN